MLEGYKEYKTTNYDWLPQIPSHWKWIYLSQSCNEQKIKNINNKENCVLSLSYGNIIRKKDINFGLVPKEYSGYQIVDKGNIILRLTDLQNDHTSLRTGLVKEKGIITSAYTCIKPHENPMYLQYLLHSYDTLKVFYGMGGGVRQSIGFKEIRNMNIPLPPRSEQDQIVRYLDWKVSMINKYINAKKKQIELLKEHKQAIINQSVTKGLDMYVSMKDSGIEWLGKVPAHWEVMKLKHFANVNPSINNFKYNDKDEVIFLPMENINVDGTINNSIKKYVYEVKSGFSSFAKNDVIIAKITPCFENGKGAYLNNLQSEIGFGTTELFNLRAKENILPEYLYWITMSSQFRILGERTMTGTAGQKRITTNFVSCFTIAIPDILEQEKIINVIKKQVDKTNIYIDNANIEIQLLQEYRTRLISDVVTGRVNVQDVKVPEFIIDNQEITEIEGNE